jgi:hypothetical protein
VGNVRYFQGDLSISIIIRRFSKVCSFYLVFVLNIEFEFIYIIISFP